MYSNGLYRAVNAFVLSRRGFIIDLFYFSQSWILSAFLSSLSPSQSHISYVRRLSLNSNQGKIISDLCCLLIKELRNLRFYHFALKMTKLLLLVHSFVTVPSSDWLIARYLVRK